MISQSAGFTLGFALGAAHPRGLDECIIMCVHPYGIAALEIVCAPPSMPCPLPDSLDRVVEGSLSGEHV